VASDNLETNNSKMFGSDLELSSEHSDNVLTHNKWPQVTRGHSEIVATVSANDEGRKSVPVSVYQCSNLI